MFEDSRVTNSRAGSHNIINNEIGMIGGGGSNVGTMAGGTVGLQEAAAGAVGGMIATESSSDIPQQPQMAALNNDVPIIPRPVDQQLEQFQRLREMRQNQPHHQIGQQQQQQQFPTHVNRNFESRDNTLIERQRQSHQQWSHQDKQYHNHNHQQQQGSAYSAGTSSVESNRPSDKVGIGWYNHALEYKSGVEFRSNILLPVIDKFVAKGQHDIEREAKLRKESPQLLNLYSRGKSVLITPRLQRTEKSDAMNNNNSKADTKTIMQNAYIEKITYEDANTINDWYGRDKLLSYVTGLEYSDWWVTRCRHLDSNCEMIKLCIDANDDESEEEVNDNAQEKKKKKTIILGIAYFERNIVDVHTVFEDEDDNENVNKNANGNVSGARSDSNGFDSSTSNKKNKIAKSIRTTLIRGIRLSPFINPEVLQREYYDDIDLADERDRDNGATSRSNKTRDDIASTLEYRGVATALLDHILFLSVRYGAQCVSVYSPKNEVAENFYLKHFGKPIALHNTDGRRYYRVGARRRWILLQKSFERQLKFIFGKAHQQNSQHKEDRDKEDDRKCEKRPRDEYQQQHQQGKAENGNNDDKADNEKEGEEEEEKEEANSAYEQEQQQTHLNSYSINQHPRRTKRASLFP